MSITAALTVKHVITVGDKTAIHIGDTNSIILLNSDTGLEVKKMELFLPPGSLTAKPINLKHANCEQAMIVGKSNGICEAINLEQMSSRTLPNPDITVDFVVYRCSTSSVSASCMLICRVSDEDECFLIYIDELSQVQKLRQSSILPSCRFALFSQARRRRRHDSQRRLCCRRRPSFWRVNRRTPCSSSKPHCGCHFI